MDFEFNALQTKIPKKVKHVFLQKEKKVKHLFPSFF